MWSMIEKIHFYSYGKLNIEKKIIKMHERRKVEKNERKREKESEMNKQHIIPTQSDVWMS